VKWSGACPKRFPWAAFAFDLNWQSILLSIKHPTQWRNGGKLDSLNGFYWVVIL
jgi:hypothetical protein